MANPFRNRAVYGTGVLLVGALVALGLHARDGAAFTALDAVVPQSGRSSTSASVFSHESPDATAGVTETDEEANADTMPTLPPGMTVATLREGDAIFHGAGGCYQCHGMEGTGMRNRGSSLTAGLIYEPTQGAAGWQAVDSLVLNGVPEEITRSQVAMPMRGLHSDLSAEDVRLVAAYVWAIAQVKGEPWPGGHVRHATSGRLIDPRTTGP